MDEKYNAEIWDGKEIFPALIPDDEIPAGSISRFMRGQYRHFLYKDKEGKYQAAVIPEAKAEDVTPSDLYDCLEDVHSPRLFCNKEHPAKKWATIGLYVIAGFLIFFVFLIWAANLG